MLAQTYKPELATFPLLVTPKIDGIRFYIEADHAWTRKNKSVPNINIQRDIKNLFPDGIDGELCVDNSFNKSQSLVMSDGNPLEDAGLIIYIFDWYQKLYPEKRYMKRVEDLNELRKEFIKKGWSRNSEHLYSHPRYLFKLRFLFPLAVTSYSGVDAYFESQLTSGFEGIILRTNTPYHFGRSPDMLKLKPFEDREAVIIGVEELLHNTNEAFTNELGQQKRSSASAGLVGAGVMGSLFVRDLETQVAFNVGGGPGLTHLLRMELWNKRHTLPGLVIKYSCLPYGEKEKPRHPKFLGFRDVRD
jgi:DNA ligase-1